MRNGHSLKIDMRCLKCGNPGAQLCENLEGNVEKLSFGSLVYG
jgi:hypothetical protein